MLCITGPGQTGVKLSCFRKLSNIKKKLWKKHNVRGHTYISQFDTLVNLSKIRRHLQIKKSQMKCFHSGWRGRYQRHRKAMAFAWQRGTLTKHGNPGWKKVLTPNKMYAASVLPATVANPFVIRQWSSDNVIVSRNGRTSGIASAWKQ